MRFIQKCLYWGQEINNAALKLQRIALRFIGKVMRKKILAERARFQKMLKDKHDYFEKKRKKRERLEKMRKIKMDREKEKEERLQKLI